MEPIRVWVEEREQVLSFSTYPIVYANNGRWLGWGEAGTPHGLPCLIVEEEEYNGLKARVAELEGAVQKFVEAACHREQCGECYPSRFWSGMCPQCGYEFDDALEAARLTLSPSAPAGEGTEDKSC